MESQPGRETKAARSPERRTWYGYGRLARVEKRGASRYLHDLTYAFADVSLFGLPAVLLVFLAAETAAFGARTLILVVWLSMTATAAAIRGGWVTPLVTPVPGWVSIIPMLIALRICYYNPLSPSRSSPVSHSPVPSDRRGRHRVRDRTRPPRDACVSRARGGGLSAARERELIRFAVLVYRRIRDQSCGYAGTDLQRSV